MSEAEQDGTAGTFIKQTSPKHNPQTQSDSRGPKISQEANPSRTQDLGCFRKATIKTNAAEYGNENTHWQQTHMTNAEASEDYTHTDDWDLGSAGNWSPGWWSCEEADVTLSEFSMRLMLGVFCFCLKRLWTLRLFYKCIIHRFLWSMEADSIILKFYKNKMCLNAQI